MNLTEIKILLDRFYDGKSSLKEERALAEFFSSEDVPSDMTDDKEIFLSLYSSVEKISVPADLKSTLSDLIDECAASGKKKNSGLKMYIRNHIHFIRNYSVAASVIILFCIGLNILNAKSSGPRETFTDPQEAYMEAEKILALVSGNLKKGMAGMELTEMNIQKVKSVLGDNKIIE